MYDDILVVIYLSQYISSLFYILQSMFENKFYSTNVKNKLCLIKFTLMGVLFILFDIVMIGGLLPRIYFLFRFKLFALLDML